MTLEDLVNKELKKAEQEQWKPQKHIKYEVRIKNRDDYYWKTFITPEYGMPENKTEEQILALADKNTAIFRVVTLSQRVK